MHILIQQENFIIWKTNFYFSPTQFHARISVVVIRVVVTGVLISATAGFPVNVPENASFPEHTGFLQMQVFLRFAIRAAAGLLLGRIFLKGGREFFNLFISDCRGGGICSYLTLSPPSLQIFWK